MPTLVLVAPAVILTNDYGVTRLNVREINDVRDDCWATQDREVLSIREPYVKGQVSFLMPVRNPVHFLAVNLRVPSPQLFVLLLDSPVQPSVFCRADRLYRNTVHHHGLGFFLPRHARSPALCSRHSERMASDHLVCGWSGPLRFFWAFSSGPCSGRETAPTGVSLPVCARVRRCASIDRFRRCLGARRRARR